MGSSIAKRTAFLVLLVSVVLNAAGQIFFKAVRLSEPDASLLQLFFQIETWAGLVLYGMSAISWLWILSRSQLSFAYPVLALSFPIVVGLSAALFGETITLFRGAGIGLIILGVSLLART